MAPPPTALRLLVDAARSSDHLFELLRLAGCLTPRARTNRSTVTATMTRARDAFEPPYSVGVPPDEGHHCRDAWDAVEEALTNAGYLQAAAWSDAWKYVTMSGVEERVQRIIDDAPEAADTANSAAAPWIYAAILHERERRHASAQPGPIPCPSCQKPLPDEARFCVWCRADLPFRCSCLL